jgi:hypothetical protein
VSAQRSNLRRVFDRAERAVGAPLEDLVASSAATNLLIVAKRVQGALSGAIERRTRSLLHIANIPAHSDLQRNSRQLSALIAEVRRLTAAVETEVKTKDDSRDA